MARIPQPKFNLKNPNGKTSPINLVYYYRNVRLKYSTNIKIRVGEWSFKTQRPIEMEGRPDLWTIKAELDAMAAHAKDIYIKWNYGQISPREFKVTLDKALKRTTGPKPKTERAVSFLEFADLEIADMSAAGMKPSSIKMFKKHVHILKKFARSKGSFSYEDVNWTLRLKLIDWLSANNVQVGYGNKTLKILRQFMERARRKGLHNFTGHQGQRWQVQPLKAKGTKVTVTEQELDRLAKLELSGYLKKVRDLFLIGVGTGQRFSDFSRLCPEHFYRTLNDVPLLSIISQKTGTPAKIPLNVFPWLIPLLEEYEYHAPKLSMQKFNQGLKILCEQAGFDERVLIVEQYMGRKPRLEQRFVPKSEMISSHTCRRTFATILYRRGYALAQIMHMTGHSTEAQLRLYIGIDAEENAEQIALAIQAKANQAVA